MDVPDKNWIEAIGSRILDALSSSDLDIETKELIVATTQFGLMLEPHLLKQFKEGNSLIESSFFENDDDFPRHIQGQKWKMTIRKSKRSIV
jgi:hypothetical protein